MSENIIFLLNALPAGVSTQFSLSLADPVGSSPLVVAALWLQNTLLGTIALTVAIIAVATVGLMLLTGRVHLRFGASVIGGCFVLFGAPSIVAGIQSATSSGDDLGPDSSTAVVISPPLAVSVPPSLPVQAPRSDPYAGASVPNL